MALALELKNPSLATSTKVPLTDGMTLGRKGSVVLNDNKASSVHARIRQTQDGGWRLEDNQSKNGTRSGGVKIQFLDLTVGISFNIGDYVVTVIEHGVVTQDPPAVPQAAAEVQKSRKWNEHLADFLRDHEAVFVDEPRLVSPFAPAVILDFLKGLQANTRWVVGYGPRKVGRQSLDLPILEPQAPEVCFELRPSSDGIIFYTEHTDLVQLNGQPVTTQPLRVGDIIRIFETMIEVDFVE